MTKVRVGVAFRARKPGITALQAINSGKITMLSQKPLVLTFSRNSRRAISKVMHRADLCRMVWVRPLKHPRADLVAAALQLVRRGARLINIMTHSSECFPGTAPQTRNEDDLRRLHGDIEAVVTAVREAGVTPRTLSDALAAG